MIDCTKNTDRFDTLTGLALEAAFDGGRITSDGGLVWIAEADKELGLCEALAQYVPEWRRGNVRHSLLELVRQRVYQIACGYEDQDDSDYLRADPLLKLVCGKLPETGAELASQPSISRLENAPGMRDCYRMAESLAQIYIRQRAKAGTPKRVLLDFDSTDDPAHGEQEGSYYHGYYEEHMYHPLLVFDGDTDQLITAVLRPGNTHASRGARMILSRLTDRLRREWPGVNIELRADAGFATHDIYEYCEAHSIKYVIGLITNRRLERLAEPLLERATVEYEQQQQKVRLISEFEYQAGSWDTSRRVVYKAEAMEQGTNTRFVVTNKGDEPKALYECYVRRGNSENWIKDFKLYCKADRLSCHRFVANQFRLLLHAAAYWLLDTIRGKLIAAGIERLQMDTLTLRLVKIGGRVKQLLTKVRLHLASSHPGQPLWQAPAQAPE